MKGNLISFRAWDKNAKMMLYRIEEARQGLAGFDGIQADSQSRRRKAISCFGDFLAQDHRYEVEQWTGLYDVTETMIFVGDVIKNKDGDVFRVGYDPSKAQFTALKLAPFPNRKTYHFQAEDRTLSLVVVGNIHENPELLANLTGGTTDG